MPTETTSSHLAAGLAEAVNCNVLYPGSREYDIARRIWNADIDRFPAAIVQVRSAQDVSDVIGWCNRTEMPITVRSGGHNLAGTSVLNNTVQIDTRLLNDVVLDEDGETISVGAGCNWGQVDRACEDSGRVVPAGVVSHTGVAGLSLGGGYGYLNRLYGATIDHIEEIEVVVASGEILTANKTSHAELFASMKGAGHNYGVATRFTFRTRPIPGLATVRIALFAAEDRAALLARFGDLSVGLPSNVGTYLRLYKAPEYWTQIPKENRGKQILSLSTVTYGDPELEPELTASMFEGFSPIYLDVRTMPHATLQHSTDDEFRYGIRHYWKHTFVDQLTPEVIETILDWVETYPGRTLNSSAYISHQVMCPFEIIAGTGSVRANVDNALPSGAVMNYSANIGADWEYPSEKQELVDWVRSFSQAMEPFNQGTYINFTSVQGDDEVARSVYGDKYPMLVATKAAYDPRNIFRRGLVDLTDSGDE